MSVKLHGIDVSVYQGNIDWKKVYDSGIYFAMIKSSQGCSVKEPVGNYNPFVDSKFKQNIINAYEAGIKCGVYHYVTCTTIEQAEKESDFLLSAINQYKDKITFPVAIDIEESRYCNRSLKEQNTKFVRIFAEKLKSAGYKPILYSYRSFLNNYIDLDALKDIDIWLAVYFTPRRTEPAPDFNNMTMWQWTSSGVTIPGINVNVDCNIAYKNYAQIKGDLNNDGIVDSVDALILKRCLTGSFDLTDEQKQLADINDDGEVDSLDYLSLRRKIISAL